MQRVLYAVGVAAVALAVGGFAGAGCGGTVTVVDDGEGGAGGAGGPTTGNGASGGIPTTDASSTAGDTSQSSATPASSTAVSVSSSSVTATSVNSVSATVSTGSGGPFACPTNVVPPQFCQDCVDDATDGPCQPELDACVGDAACLQFANCAFNCQGDAACCAGCGNGNPIGAALYADVVDCAVCTFCNFQCQSTFTGFSTCM